MNKSNLRTTRPLPRAAGFTLMEMIAVIVLLGIVITIVGGGMMNTFGGGKWKAGTIQVKKLSGSVEQYQMNQSRWKRPGIDDIADTTSFGHIKQECVGAARRFRQIVGK